MHRLQKFLYSKLRIGIYRSSIYRADKKKLRNVAGTDYAVENNPIFSTDNVIFLDEFKQNLYKCSKNGGYKKYFGNWIWVNHKIKYFLQDNNKIINWGGVPNFIKKAQLVYLENSIIYPNKYSSNFRQKYTFYVKQIPIDNYDIKEAISFNVGGSNSFQHFMQDCLPIIVKSKKFLVENSHTKILLPKANNDFTNREYLLKRIGVNNEIIETDSIFSLKIQKLFFWNFVPYNSQYNLPPIFYIELRKALMSKTFLHRTRTIVLMVRSEKMRKFENIQEIKDSLKIIADLHELDLVILDTSHESIEEVRKKIEQALVVIGIHGGNTYNAIFCQNDCTVIEILPMKNTNSNINFLAHSGIRYIPFPSNFDFFDEKISVPIYELKAIISKVLN